MKGKPVGFKMRNKELARKKIVQIEIKAEIITKTTELKLELLRKITEKVKKTECREKIKNRNEKASNRRN